MSKLDKIKEEIDELVNELNKYAYSYYVLDNPIISDKEYDVKYDNLMKLETETGYINPNSPTQRVGDTILKGFKKVRHRNHLWSLDKAQTKQEVQDYINRCDLFVKNYNRSHSDKLLVPQYIVTQKFDGLTINTTYEDKKMIQSATRGTGEIGEKITEQSKTIINLPKEIQAKSSIDVHGEALMSKNAFKEYNANLKNNEEPLKNLRNGAAGALRNLNIKESARRKLITQYYDLSYYDSSLRFDTYIDTLEFMQEQGFTVADYVICNNFDEVNIAIDHIGDIRDSLQYDIDGVVITLNDLKTRELMGYTIKFPKYAIAYKFEAKEVTTKLLNVEWQTGRTGKLTPRATVKPIELMGVTVTHATLNNIDDIKRKNVKIGGRVLLRRSNDVIPEIMGNADDEGTEILPPIKCPSCGGTVIQDGVHYFCENTLGCRPQLVKSIVHFCEREAMNIEGFSEKTADLFLDNNIINTIIDLYKLEDKKREIINLPKYGLKKYNNLIENINKSKHIELYRFIYGLGIEGIGIKTAKDICNQYKTIDKLKDILIKDLLKIKDIGDTTANNFYSWMHDENNISLLNQLLEYITFEKEKKVEVKQVDNNILQGKHVYPTGKFQLKKSELKEKLEQLGAIVESGFKKSLDYLICGGDTSKSGKVQKAIDNNVPLMTEDELMELINKLE